MRTESFIKITSYIDNGRRGHLNPYVDQRQVGQYQVGWKYSLIHENMITMFNGSIDEIVRYGNKDLIASLYMNSNQTKLTNRAVAVSAMSGDLIMLQHLATTYNLTKHKDAIEDAIILGKTHVVPYLRKNGNKFGTPGQIDVAAQMNDIATVKWLMQNNYTRCTDFAFSICIRNNYFELLRFLKLNKHRLTITKY
jgi:hypothetical protein